MPFLVYIGKIYYFQMEFEKAHTYFGLVFHKNRHNYNALYWIIRTEEALKKDPKSILLKIDEYLKVDSNNSEILYIKGNVCKKLGKFDEALTAYERVILSSGTIAMSYYEIGKFYDDAGLKSKANLYFEAAKSISLHNPVLSKISKKGGSQ